jgi:hypothetical protein
MVCSACLPPVAGSEAAVEQVGRYTRRQAVRRGARDTGEWYSAPYRASQLGCVVWWFLWMASPGPLEHRYLTCAKVSEQVSMTVVLNAVQSVHQLSREHQQFLSSEDCTGTSMLA